MSCLGHVGPEQTSIIKLTLHRKRSHYVKHLRNLL